MSVPRAFVIDWRGVPAVTLATSAGQARFRCFRSCRDVYDRRDVRIQDFRVRRAPALDAALRSLEARETKKFPGRKPCVWSEEYIENESREMNRTAEGVWVDRGPFIQTPP